MLARLPTVAHHSFVLLGLIFQLIFINVPSEQPDGQLQQQRNTETQIAKDNKQET